MLTGGCGLLEVIVADDGSPEPPVVPAGVRLVRQEDEGFRLAAVRNLGVAAASGDILIFLDADTTPEPSFVVELSRLPALAPDCVVVGRRRHADLAGVPTRAPIETAAVACDLPEPAWLADAYAELADLRHADDRSYRYVIGAVLGCSRRMFDDAGAFDESFTDYGGEDWEWAYRAWIRGGMLAHVPSAVAWHDGPDAGGRASTDDAKNREAIRLADLIPVPGSGARGRLGERIDIAVSGPPPSSTAGQVFVSVDSVLAALPPAAWIDDRSTPVPPWRLDRVRVHVELLRPVRVSGSALAEHVAGFGSDRVGELVLRDGSGVECIRIVSARARARERRWAREDLFSRATAVCAGLRTLGDEVDVEGYLGGWA